ncbi:hypothetical protein M569_06354, partial [Genlisea aurea]
PENKVNEDEDGLFSILISWLRIFLCCVSMTLTTLIWSMIMVILLPWPYLRIKQGNIYGHVSGRLLMGILGNPIKIEGGQYRNEPAIYVCNHASVLDVILTMWLTPTGTVGIAKKEVIFYPLFGQLFLLANHLRIDRSNPKAAIESMKQAGDAVVKNNLSLIMFPEGTRSKTGRLLPFKKGFVHLAVQTRRRVVPIVIAGTHRAWRKGSMRVRPVSITVRFLPPIGTDDWTLDRVDEHVKMVRDVFVHELPASQRPL